MQAIRVKTSRRTQMVDVTEQVQRVVAAIDLHNHRMRPGQLEYDPVSVHSRRDPE